MRAGLYKVKTVDKRTALLVSLKDSAEQYTYPIEGFTHDVNNGDVVEVWQEGTRWRTKYVEEKTRSVSSHTKDFMKRMMDQE
ncbi:hypothetical protein [Planococcus maitriensis]|uniref:DUF3006 domain-containing protein n=1 Tax=Planococcus maitriensis TaxID=221799 RepID=A0A365K0C8_9BACL|nr:hypothetical protein [Planococcus maitriensis]RAZ65937.1 hypothetical protein DP119_15330 [Planococcus maitriensis]